MGFFLRFAEKGAPGDLHIASISDMIRGGASPSAGEGGDAGRQGGFKATFEVTTDHNAGTWYLVSIDKITAKRHGPRRGP